MRSELGDTGSLVRSSGTRHSPSRQLLSAWAKYDRTTDESLSLLRHSEDAAEVAGRLWDEWLPPATRRILAGDSTDAEARILGQFLAGTHDVGKLSPVFAVQVELLCGPMRDAGLMFPHPIDHRSDTPHSAVSFVAMEHYLIERGFDRGTARSYAIVVGSHHGVTPDRKQTKVSDDPPAKHYGDAPWETARMELIADIADLVGASDLLPRWAARPLSIPQQVLWTGFVIMADWIASNSELFPLSGRSESAVSAEQAWRWLDLPAPWAPAPPSNLGELMSNRFRLPAGAQPNPVQTAVFREASAMEEPGMLIVEATMGSGKTEAALAAAEILAAKFGLGGVFVALPTMATSDAMFGRVHDWLTRQPHGTVTSVQLAHGKSHLNETFRKLDRARLVDIGADDPDDLPHQRTEVIAHQWFFGRKRAMLAGFVVGTIDQLLFGALKAKHVMLRHLALSNKVVIVDEVHAADDYMRHYLVRVLEWLGTYRVPAILLSATLPGHQRVELVEAYERGRGITDGAGDPVTGSIGYPVVTTVQRQRSVSVVPVDGTRTITVSRITDDDATLVQTLRAALAGGGCAAVLRNTVTRAQQTARALRAECGDAVVLLHSRFAARHRSDLEKHLVAQLGRDGSRPHRLIVVATQVIEQSLDLDFDLMISDLAPIDLLFQRVGRLHRHQRPRPAGLATACLILTGVEDWEGAPPEPVSGSVAVYGRSRLYRAAAVLAGRTLLAIPDDIPVRVQEAYSGELVPPPGWESALSRADDEYAAHAADQRDRADSWRLSPPRVRSLIGWLAQNTDDADGARGHAKVRDSEDGIEVILTQRVGGRVYLLNPCGGDLIDTEFEPDPPSLARKVLESSIRLPQELCLPRRIDQTIRELEQRMYPGWQESRWLAGELVVELDEDGVAEVNGHRLTYTEEDGLVIERIVTG